MWRREDIAVCVVLMLATAGVARAQWSSNAWPSQEYPFQGYVHGSEAVSAAVERCRAVGVTALSPANRSWLGYYIGKQRNKLQTTKTLLARCVDSGRYVKAHLADEYGLNGYFATADVNTVFWTGRVEILTYIGAPTNWFDETPWFSLHADSNGWRHVPALASNLVWTIPTNFYWYLHETNNINNRLLQSGSTQDWATAIVLVESNWTAGVSTIYSNELSGIPVRRTVGQVATNELGEESNWFANMLNKFNALRIEGAWTNYARAVDWYWRADASYLDTFDDYGVNVTTTLTRYATTEPAIWATTNSPMFGETNQMIVFDGEWAAEPTVEEPFTSRGWQVAPEPITNYLPVLKWNVTGGFAYP